mmetsp:Transcript_15495/g.23405  ORF Transcript_15495/g.23405 Transcript_15495/m.23405 type:complete len:394 (-) Transcript_15495:136-1317(-)
MKDSAVMSTATKQPWYMELTDLACSDMGTKIVFATDEWFAAADNLLQKSNPIFIDDKFTTYGKWMDGWESRRKRTAGHDWSIIELGHPGAIRGIVLDTRFFTGNQAPRFSLQAVELKDTKLTDSLLTKRKSYGIGTKTSEEDLKTANELKSDAWTEIIPFTKLNPGYEGISVHHFEIDGKFSGKRWTHLRLNMFPDGGIARLRAYGLVKSSLPAKTMEDLAAARNGGVALAVSDAHYGKPANLIAIGRAPTMADGWETARKPNRPAILKPNASGMIDFPDFDWCILRLCTVGNIVKLLIDTNHFKGNFPESCIVEGCLFTEKMDYKEETKYFSDPKNLAKIKWTPVLPRVKLGPHREVTFELPKQTGPISHIRLTIYPDGGISRLRVYGTKAE